MSKHITYNKVLNDAYLKSFFNTLDELLTNVEKTKESQQSTSITSISNSKRDQLLPIYMYCKNLWDKWLIHPNTVNNSNNNPYTVERFFDNFLFIDSFYRNIYNLLPVNCSKFMNLFECLMTSDTSDNKSLYSFIGDLAKDCKCLFVAVPDYINLGTVDNDGKMHRNGMQNMQDIFKCIPHNQMKNIQTDNKFIVIYTHEPSKNPSNSFGFTDDTIQICDSYGVITDQAKELFGGIKPPQTDDGTLNEIKLDNMTASAYPIPSFAVAFSGQNNHLFKTIDVNMDNPIATEHSINILSYIAQMGSGNGQKVAYQGQDIYPIFSNYAYQSTITMMGNVQIQPLMYYQLMNVPMWKGAYMIFNVKHSITPGNMTTTFTGMKMSKNTVPFLEKWVYPVESVVPYYQTMVTSDKISEQQKFNGIDTLTVDMTSLTGGPQRQVKMTERGPISDVYLPSNKNTGSGRIMAYDTADKFVNRIKDLFNEYTIVYKQDAPHVNFLNSTTKEWTTNCSLATYQIYKEIYNINIGTNTDTQWNSDNGIVVDINNSFNFNENGHCDGIGKNKAASKPNLDALLPGDLLYYSKPTNHHGRNYNVSHVEIYLGNGKIIGAGNSGKRHVKDALEYGFNYDDKPDSHYYIGAKRFVYKN